MLSLHSNILSTPESGCILPALSTEGTDDNILQVPSEEECVAELPKKIRETSKLSRRMITDTAHKITSVVIYCKDERKRKEAHELMLQAYNILRSGCESSSSGLVIRGSPTKGCSGQASTTQQAKRIRLKALQHARRHAESWKTRGRHCRAKPEVEACESAKTLLFEQRGLTEWSSYGIAHMYLSTDRVVGTSPESWRKR
ncbi:hypothetical protein HPB51_001307 [Rhipicephalus microplus]|uniref:Uncharacterized protein n=1 Tax=Rhipicephalus microplus TaxID=6941 RepID=A0A9J6D862_RHIMP|nr:hypothetical protein HPB51_001307 [Rhipicephalus microplus]